APEFRTNIPKLLDHDFRLDVVFRFKSDNEQAIMMIGLGTPGADGVDGAVLSRVHGPGHNGMCTFTIPGVPEQGLGRLSHSAGPRRPPPPRPLSRRVRSHPLTGTPT